MRAHRSAPSGDGLSLRHASARKDGPLPRRRGDDRVEHRVRPSRIPTSSSTATGPSGPSAVAARAPSGSPATSGPGSRSRSRSSHARESAPPGQRARWRPRRGFATSAACAPTTSEATAATSTSPTSTSTGSTLRETLRAGKLGDRDAVEAAAQILDALAHAHRIGIVHRDVKPSNVLVEESHDHLDPTPRLRPRPVRRGRHPDRGRRRAWHARIHRARASARRRRDGCERRLGGRRAALGGARRRASVLGRATAPGRRGHRGGREADRHRPRRSAARRRGRRLVGAHDRAVATSFRRTARSRSAGCAHLAAPRAVEAGAAAAGGDAAAERLASRSRSSAGSPPPHSQPSRSRSPPHCCPFWTPGLVLLLALAAGGATLRAPRLGPRDRALRAGVPARKRRRGGCA